ALIPVRQLDAQTFLLVIAVIVLSWLMAKYWSVLLPWILAHPVLVALDVMLSFVVLEIGGPSGPFLLSTVATAAISGLLFRWRGMLAVSVLQVLCYYLVLVLTLDRDHVDLATFQTILGQPLYYPLVGFAGAALRRLLDDQEEQETARRTAEVNAAAAEERTRLAREIHDSLAKTLRGISLTA
ncbi:histidine kinase, partial [Micromonospora aurantiaca]|nr:histidine kinase [Micromonospora aurantiaca]